MNRLESVNQPKHLRGAMGRTIEFIHMISPNNMMIYFTDATYMLVQGSSLEYDFVVEEMGS